MKLTLKVHNLVCYKVVLIDRKPLEVSNSLAPNLDQLIQSAQIQFEEVESWRLTLGKKSLARYFKKSS